MTDPGLSGKGSRVRSCREAPYFPKQAQKGRTKVSPKDPGESGESHFDLVGLVQASTSPQAHCLWCARGREQAELPQAEHLDLNGLR